MSNIINRFLILITCINLVNCSQRTKIIKQSEFDTAVYHEQAGNKLLAKYSAETNNVRKDYYLQKAEEELNRAKVLADKEGNKDEKIYNGLGLIQYYKNDYEKAEELFRKAKEINANDGQAYYNLGRMYLEYKTDKGWQEKAEANLVQAAARNPGHKPAHFYLGQLYYQKLDFDQARKYLNRSFNSPDKDSPSLTDKARGILKNMDIIEGLELQTPVARYIGTREKISRAELAYLIIHELLFQDKFSKKQVKVPDLPDNIYKDAVQTAVNNGLILMDGSKFYPDRDISRIELCRVLLHIYRVRTGNMKFGSQYAGLKSPFKDLRSSDPDFVPAMFARQNKFFQSGDGLFNKKFPVTGMEALQVITSFRQLLALTNGDGS